MRLTTTATALALCIACGPQFVPIQKARAPKSDWTSAVNAVADAGYDIESKDETAGLIVTNWIEGSSGVGSRWRWRLRVRLRNEGTTVEPQCNTYVEGWMDCDGRTPTPANQAAAKLASMIGGS